MTAHKMNANIQTMYRLKILASDSYREKYQLLLHSQKKAQIKAKQVLLFVFCFCFLFNKYFIHHVIQFLGDRGDRVIYK